ncbi:MAG: hypothetical protein FWG87_04995 [Defluviitaleaceae bacterium]|nr:hypothetical protein [Defluviitaleaceae bacterium]
MQSTKTAVNVKFDTDETMGERLLAAIKRKGIPNITLPTDENGHAFIDKEKYPELYDWAVRG